MLDEILMLWVNWSEVETFHPKNNRCATAEKIKDTGELELNDSPVLNCKSIKNYTCEEADSKVAIVTTKHIGEC